MISFKGARVKLMGDPSSGSFSRLGIVIAENEFCVGVRFDGIDIPAIVRKSHVSVVLDD